jgi:endopolyphosphatase
MEEEDDAELSESSFSLLLQTLSRPFTSSRRGRKRRKHPKKKRPLARHTSPRSPSRTNRFLSLLGYEQYYLDLVRANAYASPDRLPAFELEYSTYSPEKLVEVLLATTDSLVAGLEGSGSERVECLKQKHPHLTPYSMPDLTVGSWLTLAHRLGTESKLWEGFKERIYVSALKG